MPVDFSPLPPRASAVDECADAIRRRILRGELVPGVRLPPERDLAASFGVNRVTVRSALARLGAARLLSVRQGSGYVVRDFRREGGPELLPGLVELSRGDRLAEVATDLLLVRRQLARAVLERLVQGVDAEAREDVRAAVDRLAASVEHGADPATIAADDLEVLARIVDATKSAVLRLCLNPVLDVLRSLPRLRDAIYLDAQRSVAAYRVLLAWLASPHRAAIDAIVDELERHDSSTIARLRAPTATPTTKKKRRRTR